MFCSGENTHSWVLHVLAKSIPSCLDRVEAIPEPFRYLILNKPPSLVESSPNPAFNLLKCFNHIKLFELFGLPLLELLSIFEDA